jgi:hypothetical protein
VVIINTFKVVAMDKLVEPLDIEVLLSYILEEKVEVEHSTILLNELQLLPHVFPLQYLLFYNI